MPQLSALLALLSGSLVTLSLAPFFIWPLALIAAAALFLLLQNQTPKQACWLGWLFGLGMYGSGASWVYVSIHEFGYTSVQLAIFLTSAFCAGLALCSALGGYLFAWINQRLVKSRTRQCTAITSVSTFSAVWIFIEWMRTWLLSGFPWLFIGYSQTESVLAAWAPLVGVYGIGFIIVSSGASIGLIAHQILNKHNNLATNKTFAMKILPIVALTWLAAPALETMRWSEPQGGAKTVSMVQANISQHEKWQRENLQPTMALYKKLTEPYWASSELIIWPEAAVPTYYQYATGFLDQLHKIANTHNSALITGIPTRSTYSDDAYNSMVSVGNASGLYRKQRLVPFGETIPFANLLGGVLAFFELPMASMSAGDAGQAPLTIHHWQSKPLICYEVVYPGLAAEAAAVSDVLITVSNDSWFGASIGPLQHLQMAQMRARENGRYVLRSTGNGVTAIINPQGKIVQRTEQFKQTVLNGEFYLMAGQTPWTRAGYYWVPAAITLYIAVMALQALRASRR